MPHVYASHILFFIYIFTNEYPYLTKCLYLFLLGVFSISIFYLFTRMAVNHL